MFVIVSVIGSRGLLQHLVHDLIYTKINKMVAFLPISDGEHKEQPVQWPTQQQQQQQQC
jgi:hypothetical protein